MFAVITLGIGLIMVAAVFPVAIQQRKLTGEETNAAALAPGALAMVDQIATEANLPANGNVFQPLPTAAFAAVRGNLIVPSDTRVAWVPMYRREAGASVAQIMLIACQVRNRTNFINTDFLGGTIVNLRPRLIDTVAVSDTNPDQIVLTMSTGFNDAPVEGAHVVIASDGLTGVNAGRLNGRVYRLGALITQSGATSTWELVAGSDFSPDPDPDGTGPKSQINALTVATGYLIGRGLTDPTATTFEGPAMDISVFTGFVSIK